MPKEKCCNIELTYNKDRRMIDMRCILTQECCRLHTRKQINTCVTAKKWAEDNDVPEYTPCYTPIKYTETVHQRHSCINNHDGHCSFLGIGCLYGSIVHLTADRCPHIKKSIAYIQQVLHEGSENNR